jgi:cell division septal protein FtsQ
LPFEQPKKRPIKIWKPILILILIGGLYYFVFQSSFFQIKNIIVDKNLPPAVTDYMAKYKGINIFTLKSADIRDDLLSKYPELTNINVARGIPDTIKVTFNERTPKLVWMSNLSMYLVDESGIVYKEIQDPGQLIVVRDSNNLPVRIDQPIVSPSFINFVITLKPLIENNGFQVDHFQVNETTFNVDAVTQDGLILKFDITRTPDSQISDLAKFDENHKGEAKSYIDLRVEGKVFYK